MTQTKTQAKKAIKQRRIILALTKSESNTSLINSIYDSIKKFESFAGTNFSLEIQRASAQSEYDTLTGFINDSEYDSLHGFAIVTYANNQ